MTDTPVAEGDAAPVAPAEPPTRHGAPVTTGPGGQVVLHPDRDRYLDVVDALQGEGFNLCVDVTAVDYLTSGGFRGLPAEVAPERFELVVVLRSLAGRERVRLRVQVPASDPVMPSLFSRYPGTEAPEREVYDMFGIVFSDHPDLRRILTDYGFRGHPLRKDFPLSGYVEMRYSEEQKRVVYEPVRLAQDFRSFDFLSPWEGAQYILPGDEKVTGQAPGAQTPADAAGEVKK